jgi:hypothetical protein
VPRDLAGASTRFALALVQAHTIVPHFTTPRQHEYECVYPTLLVIETDCNAGYNSYETSYTSYGAGGGAGGGGFIPGDAGGSQQSPGGRRDFTQDSLRPVTIKQLLDAQLEPGSNDTFKVDGQPVSQVGCTLPTTSNYQHMSSSPLSVKYATSPRKRPTPRTDSTMVRAA